MGKSVTLDVLDQVYIASPCPKRWDDMQGDDRKRFCGDCRLNVYNISAMTREEAIALVTQTEGQLCASFYRRPDGTVLTRDCPVGLRAARAAAAAALRRIAAAVALVMGGGVMLGASKTGGWRLRQVEPFATVCRWLSPAPVPTPIPGGIIRGQLAGSVSFAPPRPPPPRAVGNATR